MREFRNNLAHKLSSWVLQNIATTEYSGYMALMIQYGMLRMAEDTGDVSGYKNHWTPTETQRWKMLGSFLSDDEAMILNEPGRIVFIERDKQQSQLIRMTEAKVK